MSLFRTADDSKAQKDVRITFTLLPDNRYPPKYTVGQTKTFTTRIRNNDIIVSPTYFQGTIPQTLPTPHRAATPVPNTPAPLLTPTPALTLAPTHTPRPSPTPFIPSKKEFELPTKETKKLKTGLLDWLPIPLPKQLTLNLWIAIALFPALLLGLYLLARRTYYTVRDWRIRRSLRRRAAQADPPPDA